MHLPIVNATDKGRDSMSEQEPQLDTVRTAMVLLYVKATPEGKLDLVESKRLLQEIASAAAPLFAYQILLDVREALSVTSVTDQFYMAEELFEHREAFTEKMAVLCSNGQYDNKCFFALCAKNRGFKVIAFTSYENAFEWLIAKERN